MDDIPAPLDTVAELGEFFSLPTAAASADWRPITTLLTDATLRDYTGRARAAIASGFGVDPTAVPTKAAASSVHLSVAARLLSPAIGAAIGLEAVPLLTADSLVWQPNSSHRPELATVGAEWSRVTDVRQAADAITGSLVNSVLRPLNDAMRQATALSPQVMLGNIASAANGAVTVLAQSRPDALRRARALVAALIAADPLTGSAVIVDGRFRRNNCCLFYQVPGGGYCGDCVLGI